MEHNPDDIRNISKWKKGIQGCPGNHRSFSPFKQYESYWNNFSYTKCPKTIRETLYKITNCLQIKVLILKWSTIPKSCFHIDSLSNRYLSNNVKVGFISFAALIIRFPGNSSAPYSTGRTGFVVTIHYLAFVLESLTIPVIVMLVTALCWWLYDGDCWWFSQCIKSVTNISNLLPTHLVSNIRHQHRCNPL